MTQNEDSGITSNSTGNAYKWWALAVICVGTFTSTLDNSIVNVAIPTLGETFSVGETISLLIAFLFTF